MKLRFVYAVAFVSFVFSLVVPSVSIAATIPLSNQLKGRILLQVESRGELWYVLPSDKKRYTLGSASQMFSVFSELAEPITQVALEKIPLPANSFKMSAVAQSMYVGRIFRVGEDQRRFWYVSPKTLKRYYFDGSQGSFDFIKKLALGISNANLARISVGQRSAEVVVAEGEDCGTETIGSLNPVSVAAQECFVKNIDACKPAHMETVGTIFGEVSYRVETVGWQGSDCAIKQSFAKNPNPAYVGKEMTCTYLDAHKTFSDNSGQSTAQSPYKTCTGALATLFGF